MGRCKGGKRERVKHLSASSHFLKGLGHVLQDGEKKSIWTGLVEAGVVKAGPALLLAGVANSSAPPTDNCVLQPVACSLVRRLGVSPPERFAPCGSLPLGLVAGSPVCMFKLPNPY